MTILALFLFVELWVAFSLELIVEGDDKLESTFLGLFLAVVVWWLIILILLFFGTIFGSSFLV